MSRQTWSTAAAALSAWLGMVNGQTPPATGTLPTVTSSPQAGENTNNVLVMRTAGQPDRKVQVLKVERLPDGKILTEVRDLVTGAIFTVAGTQALGAASANQPANSTDSPPRITPVGAVQAPSAPTNTLAAPTTALAAPSNALAAPPPTLVSPGHLPAAKPRNHDPLLGQTAPPDDARTPPSNQNFPTLVAAIRGNKKQSVAQPQPQNPTVASRQSAISKALFGSYDAPPTPRPTLVGSLGNATPISENLKATLFGEPSRTAQATAAGQGPATLQASATRQAPAPLQASTTRQSPAALHAPATPQAPATLLGSLKADHGRSGVPVGNQQTTIKKVLFGDAGDKAAPPPPLVASLTAAGQPEDRQASASSMKAKLFGEPGAKVQEAAPTLMGTLFGDHPSPKEPATIQIPVLAKTEQKPPRAASGSVIRPRAAATPAALAVPTDLATAAAPASEQPMHAAAIPITGPGSVEGAISAAEPLMQAAAIPITGPGSVEGAISAAEPPMQAAAIPTPAPPTDALVPVSTDPRDPNFHVVPPRPMTMKQIEELVKDLRMHHRPSRRLEAANQLAASPMASMVEVRQILAEASYRDPIPVVRAHCIELLTHMGYDEHNYFKYVESLVNDEEPAVQRAARKALAGR